jgi:hypothetical protein
VYIRLALSSIGRDICIYRQQDLALVHRNREIFPKEMKSWSQIGLDMHRKYQNIRFTKLDHPILPLQPLASISSVFPHWCSFILFHASNYLVFKLPRVFLFFDLYSETIKIEPSDFSRLIKFDHQQYNPVTPCNVTGVLLSLSFRSFIHRRLVLWSRSALHFLCMIHWYL